MTIDRATYEQALAQLTGPGSPFELAVSEVRGIPLRNFALRPRSLREMVVRAAEHGDAEFLVQGEQRLTYAQFARRVWGSAERLQRHGLRHGDRIAILAYNSIDYVATAFACASIGAVVVALNGWWVEEELEYALRDCGACMLIVEDRLLTRVRGLIGKLPSLEKVFVVGAGAPPPGLLAASELTGESEQVPDEALAEDDAFVILYTSGTTGRPKGCITTHRGTITQVMGILLHGTVSTLLGEPSPLPTDGSRPTSLMTAPLFHVAGIHTGVCTAMAAGAKVVLSEGRFDPEQVLRLIEKERVSTWSAIPTMLHRVVHSPALRDYDLSSLVRISFGGAPTAPETMALAHRVFQIPPSLTNGYGMTETHGIIMLAGGRDLEENPTTVGRPVAFFDVKLVDAAGREVADGELGEVLLRSATVTPGYWNRPEATAEAIRDGWLHTGDIAFRDTQGLYTLVDRLKDMIIRGGENVYCVEIENCLMEHPAIDEAAIIGVPDEEMGERVKAIVYRCPGAKLGADEVRAHVATRLAAYKVPDIVEFLDEPLPRNAAGKIVKSQMRGGSSGR